MSARTRTTSSACRIRSGIVPLAPRRRLVQHHAGVRQHRAPALRAAGEQHRAGPTAWPTHVVATGA